MTKKRELHQLREREKRDSRIKEIRSFILKKKSVSLLNNQKWYRFFEWIQDNRAEFELKTLLSADSIKSNFILELEENSILIDYSGNFIDFLELEQLTLKYSTELKTELERLNVHFMEELDQIQIQGYRN